MVRQQHNSNGWDSPTATREEWVPQSVTHNADQNSFRWTLLSLICSHRKKLTGSKKTYFCYHAHGRLISYASFLPNFDWSVNTSFDTFSYALQEFHCTPRYFHLHLRYSRNFRWHRFHSPPKFLDATSMTNLTRSLANWNIVSSNL